MCPGCDDICLKPHGNRLHCAGLTSDIKDHQKKKTTERSTGPPENVLPYHQHGPPSPVRSPPPNAERRRPACRSAQTGYRRTAAGRSRDPGARRPASHVTSASHVVAAAGCRMPPNVTPLTCRQVLLSHRAGPGRAGTDRARLEG